MVFTKHQRMVWKFSSRVVLRLVGVAEDLEIRLGARQNDAPGCKRGSFRTRQSHLMCN